MFRNLFWDMGGTMFDTYPQVDAMLARVVRERGYAVKTIEVSHLTRRSTDEAITELGRRFRIPEHEFRSAEAALKDSWRSDPPPAMPGLEKVMAAVSGLNVVVTHRDRHSAMSLLETSSIEVDDLICPEDGFPRKPDPTMYLELIHRHGLVQAECLGAGDRSIDAEAAHAAGISAAMITTPKLHLPPGPAEFTVTRLTELLELVG